MLRSRLAFLRGKILAQRAPILVLHKGVKAEGKGFFHLVQPLGQLQLLPQAAGDPVLLGGGEQLFGLLKGHVVHGCSSLLGVPCLLYPIRRARRLLVVIRFEKNIAAFAKKQQWLFLRRRSMRRKSHG